jgi:N6-adenosine-specific RNA methylase IME4
MTASALYGLGSGYGAILADPPWAFKTYSATHVTPHRTEKDHYGTMGLNDIKALPVRELAAANCALFLWVVDSHLDAAFEVGKAWGFDYKTRAFEWLKITNDWSAYRISMGYWTRKQSESCLLFTRGSPRRKDKGVRQIIEAPIREHSRKPDETYRRIERLVDGPYCELFATRYWPGWDAWGDELPL